MDSIPSLERMFTNRDSANLIFHKKFRILYRSYIGYI